MIFLVIEPMPLHCVLTLHVNLSNIDTPHRLHFNEVLPDDWHFCTLVKAPPVKMDRCVVVFTYDGVAGATEMPAKPMILHVIHLVPRIAGPVWL